MRENFRLADQQGDEHKGLLTMARYLEIGAMIAHRVRSGELSPGAELPSIRQSAREHATTSSTIGRAYRYLADAGVIALADRRRARIATNGSIPAAHLLELDQVFRLAGSDEPALQIILDHIGPPWSTVGTRGSFQGLRVLPAARRRCCHPSAPPQRRPTMRPSPERCFATAHTYSIYGDANRVCSSHEATHTRNRYR